MIARLLNGREDVLPEPFLADGPVVAFDISVLLRFAGLDVGERDVLLLRTCLQCPLTYSGPVSDLIYRATLMDADQEQNK